MGPGEGPEPSLRLCRAEEKGMGLRVPAIGKSEKPQEAAPDGVDRPGLCTSCHGEKTRGF